MGMEGCFKLDCSEGSWGLLWISQVPEWIKAWSGPGMSYSLRS